MPDRVRRAGEALALALALAVGAAAAAGSIELAPRAEPLRAGERLADSAREPGQRFALADGTRLGAVVLHERWLDYRGQSIAPGRYGLVYSLQPRSKEHVGVDDSRDFALLVPAGVDAAEDPIASSRAVSGTGHPAVMALAAWAGEGDAPAALHEVAPQRLVLFRRVDDLTLGFVVLGRAPAPEL